MVADAEASVLQAPAEVIRSLGVATAQKIIAEPEEIRAEANRKNELLRKLNERGIDG